MGTRLKNKIKSYLNNIWLIEILLVLFIGMYFGIEIYKSSLSNISNPTADKESNIILSIEATINPQGYYREEFEGDISGLTSILYGDNDFLRSIYYSNDKNEEFLKKPFVDNQIEFFEVKKVGRGLNINDNIKFIIRDKDTNKIITNDTDSKLWKSEEEYTEKFLRSYIKNKYKGREILSYYDNITSYNPAVENEYVGYDKNVLKNYEEYYYTSIDSYMKIGNKRVTYFAVALIALEIFLFFKIVILLIMNRGKVKIRGNFIFSIVYVLRYGFSYKHTRKILVITIVSLIIFFVGYLYILATSGGYESNVLSKFFVLYPIKGSVLLMTLPLIGIIYSLKKTIDIIKVNDSLNKINEGDLKYNIVENGGPETLELISNITKIKDGYQIAVEDTLRNEKLKTELISNVSHDLRTPLTSIINYVNILLEEDITEEERKDYLKIVDQKSKKLKLLIDDLFEMSKINSGKIELNKEKIDIMSLIHQTIGEYSYLYEDKDIEFKVESYSEEVFIELDGKMISRAIENIVINALKYSLTGTRVYVDVEKKDRAICISFKNISNYEMNFDDKEIFERFARGDRSRNSKVDGSGLGLGITKSIIELHKGKIQIKKEGDMFKIFIYLPMY